MKQEKKQNRVQPTSEKVEESLSYTVEVRDKEGRVLQRISAPSRSYVEQWNQFVNVHASQSNQEIRDSTGVIRFGNPTVSFLRINAAIAELDIGIRVGKGTTAVAIDNFALETPLGEGMGLDEFNHQAVTFTEPAVVASTCSFTIKRIMVNNSGATITGIREIGVYTDHGSVFSYFLIRDVLPGAVTVPDGGSITVTYTIPVTV